MAGLVSGCHTKGMRTLKQIKRIELSSSLTLARRVCWRSRHGQERKRGKRGGEGGASRKEGRKDRRIMKEEE